MYQEKTKKNQARIWSELQAVVSSVIKLHYFGCGALGTGATVRS